MKTNKLKESIMEIFANISSDTIATISANSIYDYLNLSYTKSSIKDAIIQLHNENSLVLISCVPVFYSKPSKRRFDFIFDVSKN